jgi:Fe-Mn family superoxide dismutase
MFTLAELPYAYDALEPYIDTKTMQIHHDKHHATYIKNLNDILAGQEHLLTLEVSKLVQSLDQVPENIRTKVRNNAGGHLNHSLFWQVMAPQAGGEPTGDLAAALTKTFGSFSQFQEKFSTTAINRFGSGWAWLILSEGNLAIIDTPNQDSPLMEGKTPILGLDVWEHAYYLKYQNVRADYIKNWWQVVNWTYVSKLFTSAS